MCYKTFRLVFLNKNGRVNFKDDINILKLNKELQLKQCDMAEYLIIQPECYIYEADDSMCGEKLRPVLLNKNGSVHFNKEVQLDMAEYLVFQPDCDGCYGCKPRWDLPYGPDTYKHFIADCANRGLNVRSCFICRYHAEGDGIWNLAPTPIFCKFLKRAFSSTQAVTCEYFRKENTYIKELLENKLNTDF
jgi:hypothetical protein